MPLRHSRRSAPDVLRAQREMQSWTDTEIRDATEAVLQTKWYRSQPGHVSLEGLPPELPDTPLETSVPVTVPLQGIWADAEKARALAPLEPVRAPPRVTSVDSDTSEDQTWGRWGPMERNAAHDAAPKTPPKAAPARPTTPPKSSATVSYAMPTGVPPPPPTAPPPTYSWSMASCGESYTRQARGTLTAEEVRRWEQARVDRAVRPRPKDVEVAADSASTTCKGGVGTNGGPRLRYDQATSAGPRPPFPPPP